MWVRDIMGKLKVPYVALLGNHDILGNGMDVFLKVYGDENFSFRAGNTKFVCMNTNALEFDYSHPVPDFTFMYNELQDTVGCSRTVPVMHVQPFNVEFNNNVAHGFHREWNSVCTLTVTRYFIKSCLMTGFRISVVPR